MRRVASEQRGEGHSERDRGRRDVRIGSFLPARARAGRLGRETAGLTSTGSRLGQGLRKGADGLGTVPSQAGGPAMTVDPLLHRAHRPRRRGRARCARRRHRVARAQGFRSLLGCVVIGAGSPRRDRAARSASAPADQRRSRRVVTPPVYSACGRARRGASGALYPRSAYAGLNPRRRPARSEAASARGVEGRVLRDVGPRTGSGRERSSP